MEKLLESFVAFVGGTCCRELNIGFTVASAVLLAGEDSVWIVRLKLGLRTLLSPG